MPKTKYNFRQLRNYRKSNKNKQNLKRGEVGITVDNVMDVLYFLTCKNPNTTDTKNDTQWNEYYPTIPESWTEGSGAWHKLKELDSPIKPVTNIDIGGGSGETISGKLKELPDFMISNLVYDPWARPQQRNLLPSSLTNDDHVSIITRYYNGFLFLNPLLKSQKITITSFSILNVLLQQQERKDHLLLLQTIFTTLKCESIYITAWEGYPYTKESEKEYGIAPYSQFKELFKQDGSKKIIVEQMPTENQDEYIMRSTYNAIVKPKYRLAFPQVNQKLSFYKLEIEAIFTKYRVTPLPSVGNPNFYKITTLNK